MHCDHTSTFRFILPIVCRTIIGAVAAAALPVAAVAGNINMQTVHIGNPGNVSISINAENMGQVNHGYNIGKYEVTTGQYLTFLNAVAGEDPYGLYHPSMDTVFQNRIKRTGSGTTGDPYTYSFESNSAAGDTPIADVNWGDAARFANWMDNGQPTGGENASTTEDGTYTLNGATSDSGLVAVTRNAGATWVLPTENEWFKAAYYDSGTQSYFQYPTASNTAPTAEAAPGGNNSANYDIAIGIPTPVGAYVDSSSPYGTYDQSGDVAEWTQTSPDFGTYRITRGGSYAASGGASEYDQGYEAPTAAYSNIGFRVAEVPEPTSLAFLTLLVIGGAVGLSRRRTAHG